MAQPHPAVGRERAEALVSIASPPGGSPRFAIAITHVQGGPGSTYLHEVQPGATLQCIGPQGFFTRPATSELPSLFIATGTGVTPMRSMMQAAIAAGSKSPTWLLFGVRHEADVLYADEMSAMVRQHPNVRFEPTLSQPAAGWPGRKGYVQAHVKELWAELAALPAARRTRTSAASSAWSARCARSSADDLGLPRQQVHSERYD